MAGGGRGRSGGAMSMMFGGDPSSRVAYTLNLRLGSDQSPRPAPLPKGDWLFRTGRPSSATGAADRAAARRRQLHHRIRNGPRGDRCSLGLWRQGRPRPACHHRFCQGRGGTGSASGLFSSAVPIIREVSRKTATACRLAEQQGRQTAAGGVVADRGTSDQQQCRIGHQFQSRAGLYAGSPQFHFA